MENSQYSNGKKQDESLTNAVKKMGHEKLSNS